MNDKGHRKPVKDWLKCPRCGSKWIYYVKGLKEYSCNKCGRVFVANFKLQKTS